MHDVIPAETTFSVPVLLFQYIKCITQFRCDLHCSDCVWSASCLFNSIKTIILHILKINIISAGMESSRTVLDLEDTSRTKIRGLGLGLGLGLDLEHAKPKHAKSLQGLLFDVCWGYLFNTYIYYHCETKMNIKKYKYKNTKIKHCLDWVTQAI